VRYSEGLPYRKICCCIQVDHELQKKGSIIYRLKERCRIATGVIRLHKCCTAIFSISEAKAAEQQKQPNLGGRNFYSGEEKLIGSDGFWSHNNSLIGMQKCAAKISRRNHLPHRFILHIT